MAAFGGRERFLGTNPLAVGIPAGKDRPLIFDASSSVVARGKIIVAVNAGEQPARLELDLPELSGGSVEQVSWPGARWESTFETRTVEAGSFAIEVAAREGLVLGVGSVRPGARPTY